MIRWFYLILVVGFVVASLVMSAYIYTLIPPSAPQPSISPKFEVPPAPSPPDSPVRILETGFRWLEYIGGERYGYGLYSYAIIVSTDNRSTIFMSELLRSIPPIEETGARRSQTNIFYIPIKKESSSPRDLRYRLSFEHTHESLVTISQDFMRNSYDYKMARTMLTRLCDPSADAIKSMCDGDLSRGPFIFTYGGPASKFSPVPAPFLLLDLSDVHERAFPEFVAAFKAQVKREDIADRAKIDTLRLKLLNIVLTGADWVAPVQKSLAEIVHTATEAAEKPKK